jgi:hypothetical protein
MLLELLKSVLISVVGSNVFLNLCAASLSAGLLWAVRRFVSVAHQKRILELVHTAAQHAYLQVVDRAALSNERIPNKAALGLYFFKQNLELAGVQPTEKHEAQAAALFRVLHGEEKLAGELAKDAAPLTIGAGPVASFPVPPSRE